MPLHGGKSARRSTHIDQLSAINMQSSSFPPSLCLWLSQRHTQSLTMVRWCLTAAVRWWHVLIGLIWRPRCHTYHSLCKLKASFSLAYRGYVYISVHSYVCVMWVTLTWAARGCYVDNTPLERLHLPSYLSSLPMSKVCTANSQQIKPWCHSLTLRAHVWVRCCDSITIFWLYMRRWEEKVEQGTTLI